LAICAKSDEWCWHPGISTDSPLEFNRGTIGIALCPPGSTADLARAIRPGRHVRRWELLADRSNHRFLGRLEVSFVIDVSGDTLRGTEAVRTFDADGVSTGNIPTPAPITGQRITPR
jgi:hypothetical protein